METFSGTWELSMLRGISPHYMEIIYPYVLNPNLKIEEIK
jgi:hypothetical protein